MSSAPAPLNAVRVGNAKRGERLRNGIRVSALGVRSGLPAQTGNYSAANGFTGRGATHNQTATPTDCGDVVYVTESGAGLQNGSSWANAFAGTSLQTAINTAATCGAQVWVAQGLYKPTTGTDRTISFTMKEGVAIYGGFSGTEKLLSDRPAVDPVTGQPSSSTLSGDIGTPGNKGYSSDNSNHILYNGPGLTASAILDGFVITQGAASYEDNRSGAGNGGAIYNEGSSPTIRNCWILDNSAGNEGGAIYNITSNPLLTACRFGDNEAGRGGSIANLGTSSLTITNSLFENQVSECAGVVYNDGTITLTINNTTFRGNRGSYTGSVCSFYDGSLELKMTDCLFENNQSEWCGPIYHRSKGTVVLTRCQFINNSATDDSGGALWMDEPGLEATDCRFVGNSSTSDGGAIYYNSDQKMKLTNCDFEGNHSLGGDGGGAISAYRGPLTIINSSFISNTSASSGGALTFGGENPLLINCSFLKNQANRGGAIFGIGQNTQFINCSFQANQGTNGGVFFSDYGSTLFSNCVFYGNSGSQAFVTVDGSNASVRSSLVESSTTGYTDGGNNLTTTVTPFASTTSTELRNCSPAINTGSNDAYSSANGPATDLAGNTRLFSGGVIDMGAYEYQGNPTTLTVSNPSVATATVGQPFSQSFTAQGGSGAYSFSVVSANLPSSLSLSASGVLSGTPTVAGSYSVLVSAQDQNGCVGTATTAYSLTVSNAALPCGTVVFVTQNGAGLQNGSSWANAFAGTSLQTAINTAATCGAQVWVAQGLYKPTTGTDQSISFILKEGVSLYGGFAGTEDQLVDRPAVNPVTGSPSSSTLSGDIGQTNDFPIIRSDNSGHVLRSEPGLTASTVLDGFVITRGNAGNAYGVQGGETKGGGLYNVDASPSIRNCFFVDNEGSGAGGSLYNRNGNLNISQCRFGDGGTTARGLALANTGVCSVSVTGSLFTGQVTDAGGSIVENYEGTIQLTVTNTTFRQNTLTDGTVIENNINATVQLALTDCMLQDNTGEDGAIFSLGPSSVVLTRCQFIDNKATDYSGGAIYISNGGNLEANDCRFASNSAARDGGAISFSNDNANTLKLTNCVFENNQSHDGDGGGAVYINGGSATIINSRFVNNSATNAFSGGGALYLGSRNSQLINCSFVGNTTDKQGGAVYSGGDARLLNCSFQGNQATQGGWAIYSGSNTTQLVNSVLFGNGGASTFGHDDGRSLSVSYSLFEPSVTGYTDAGNNLTTTLSPFTSTTSTQLRDCASAINTGSNQAYSAASGPGTDLAGNNRFFNSGVIDRGAYEYQGTPTTLTVTNPAVSTATVGQAFSQTFTASGGAAPYSYSLGSGSLPASLSLSSAGVLSGTPTEVGSYSITVPASDANGCSGTGSVYALTVRPTTSFTVVQAPANQTACVGSSVTFSVRVTPDQGVTYAWFKNSADPRQPVQATTPDYTVEVTDGGKAGRYIVRITGVDGSTVEQRETYLTVNQRPVSPPPTSTRRQLCPDATPVNLSQYVSRTNNNYTVRYYQASGQLLPSSSVVLDQPGTYSFMVTQFDPATGCESVPTSFTLTVNTMTQLLANPTSQTACSGSNVTLTVQATGTNLKYEWFRGSVANQNKLAENASRQTGTTTASLTLVRVSQSEQYFVRVTGECGVVVSSAIAVTVQACGARQGVAEPAPQALQVTVLGNPTESEWVDVVLAGAGSEAVRLAVSDERGYLISEQHLNAPQANGRQRVRVGQVAGHYFLQVSTATRRQTVKVLKR
ncbi:hypothetical protein BN8_02060 [Fibrisoma limi BUZ 3]|uniref:Uncharacterized protein n=2 Tax=Fibrisoma limi TaxID=663275 RepID=I2GGI1_9BACT|nr:hypothetical protein BN8_02060 [Fibrisoma limi BUZ 3]